MVVLGGNLATAIEKVDERFFKNKKMVNPGIARVLTQVVLTGGRIVGRAVMDAYKAVSVSKLLLFN